jgi:hypothetical protein
VVSIFEAKYRRLQELLDSCRALSESRARELEIQRETMKSLCKQIDKLEHENEVRRMRQAVDHKDS